MAQALTRPKTQPRPAIGSADQRYRSYVDGRIIGLRVNRYSWWTHWRELADYFLPRRYRWIITPNQMSRGSPINQHILDSTGCIAARNLASGLVSGKSSPTAPWFRLRVGTFDSTQTSPVSLWLAECERILYLIFSESNFYNAIAVFYFDLVIFGTGSIIEYEDFENVARFYNPCAGEYYVDIDGKYRPVVFYREFTMTVAATVNEFGYENCSDPVRQLFDDPTGADLTRELVIAHSIEPNDDGKAGLYGFPAHFKYREVYWEWGGTTSPQGGVSSPGGFLRKGGFMEQAAITARWDLVSNDAYGRSPAMDALPDQKQLQLETRRKLQAIDKMVNPPLVADSQLKNQPASLLPGGITFVSGYTASGKPGFSSVYDTKFPVDAMTEDLNEVRSRLGKTFFNDVLMTASQYETRSNVTQLEWNMRKSESMVMLGPALERIDHEALSPIIERTFAIAARAGLLPPAPPEIQGQMMNIEYISMLTQAQKAAASSGIEVTLKLGGELQAIDPAAMDNIDVDYALEKYSELQGNDPKMIRSPEALQAIRQDRQQQAQAQQKAAMAEQYSKAAQNLSGSQVGEGQNALELALGGGNGP